MEPEKYSQWGNPDTENNCYIFSSHMWIVALNLEICVHLRVPTEVSGLEIDHGDRGVP